MRTEKFASIISSALPLDKLSLPAASPRFLDTISVEIENGKFATASQIQISNLPFATTDLQQFPIKEAKIIFEGENVKKVIEMVLDLGESKIEFLPGDTIGIMPENVPHEVETVMNSLKLTSATDKLLEITVLHGTKKKNAKIPPYLPKACTAGELLTKFLDIRATPKKLFIRSLIDHTSNDSERKFLEILCCKEGSELYTKCIEQKFTFIDLLLLCPSCCPPLGLLLEHLPRLLPRPYSIANSPLSTPEEIKIIFSVLSKPCVGLTTSQLESKCNNFFTDKNNPSHINLYFRNRNKFKYSEEDYTKNVALIGVGVGVAPFLGFLEHQSELKKFNPNATKGSTWVFTGSRSSENALYREELKNYVENGVIQEFYESFSRDESSKYKYVQDHIKEIDEKFVNFILLDDSVIYVCADGALISKDIENCILECIENVLNISKKDAKQIVLRMKRDSKYIEDVWS